MRYVIGNKLPFMMGKIGGTELFILQTIEFYRKRLYKMACEQGCRWSGIYPEDVYILKRFTMVMKDAIGEADILLHWQKYFEAYFINRYGIKIKGIFREWLLVPWGSENPWTKELRGRKVLVISPFESSIRKQYQKREKLFKNQDILPDFELYTLKAVQSLGGICEEGYKDWFEALEVMMQQIEKIEFDIALIGCGAYGLPLAAKVKRMGKVAVHMGGDLQMLFGIMGKRWEKNPTVQKIVNEYWIYPERSERPEFADMVEDGCYW